MYEGPCVDDLEMEEVGVLPADHVPGSQPHILLGMVEARSVNVKNTTTATTTVNTHPPDHRAQCPSNTFQNADLLWRACSREQLSDDRLLEIRFEVFAGVFTALIGSPNNDTAAERNDG